MNTNPPKKNTLPTYIFVDASNIRNACSRSSKFELDFLRLIAYFKSKYPNFEKILYFEGLSTDDQKKKQELSTLHEEGYSIFSLERKAYKRDDRRLKCDACGNYTTVKPSSSFNLKSNVDVYLCSEFVSICLGLGDKAAHFVLVSCDGDYAEMIKKCLNARPNIYVSVLSTPYKSNGYYDRSINEFVRTGDLNFLSSRLADLRVYPNFMLIDIETIQDHVRILEEDTPGILTYSIRIDSSLLDRANKKGDTEVEPLSDGG